MPRPPRPEQASSQELAIWTEVNRLIDTLKSPEPDFEGWTRFFIANDSETRPLLGRWNFRDLIYDIGEKPAKELSEFPALKRVMSHFQNVVADTELARTSDTPEPTTHYVRLLHRIDGGDRYLRVLESLRDLPVCERTPDLQTDDWTTGYTCKSHLLRVARPAPGEDLSELPPRLRALNLPEERWIEAMIVNPTWSSIIAHALEIRGLDSLSWWHYGHTLGRTFSRYTEFEEYDFSSWSALSEEELRRGAFDLVWFEQLTASVGIERIDRWLRVAGELQPKLKYGASGYVERLQHAVDARLGRLDRTAVFKRSSKKRHHDSIHAVGLLPLAAEPERRADLNERFQLLREIRRTGKKLGSERRENERARIDFAIDALAWQCDRGDPWTLRMEIETDELSDLAEGPVVVEAGGAEIALRIDPATGHSEVDAMRNGKPLKSLPAAARKEPEVKELLERRKDLHKQSTELRAMLETAMVQQRVYTMDQMDVLRRHPLLNPLLRMLVWVEDGDPSHAGYLTETGDALMCPGDAEEHSLTGAARLRIAHPCDLAAAGVLEPFQRDTGTRGLTQPFKQLFREMTPFPATAAEADNLLGGYRGRSFDCKRLLGVMQSRSWMRGRGSRDGEYWKLFGPGQAAGVIEFDNHLYGSEEVALARVGFVEPATCKRVSAAEVSPIVFSEVVRDVELLISTAAAVEGKE